MLHRFTTLFGFLFFTIASILIIIQYPNPQVQPALVDKRNNSTISILPKTTLDDYQQNNTTRHEETDSNNNCLIPTKKNGPKPIILMSLGRSGSGSTWQILGNLTGKETGSRELTGSNTGRSQAFFDQMPLDDGGNWLLSYMCYQQKKHKKAGIVGFKWKPYKSIFTNQSIAGLELISKLQHNDPPIRIVRSRRNLLDVEISRSKHMNSPKVAAHCEVGDTKCAEEHMKLGTGLTIETRKLIRDLRTLTELENKVDQLLVDMNIPHIQVSYEKLYHSNDATEWNRILHFIDVYDPKEKNITYEDVRHAMGHAFTSNKQHNVTLKNYNEVRSILNGTEFETLLHR